MSKNKDMIVAGAGWLSSVVIKFMDALHKRGVSDEEIHALATNKGNELIDKIADLIAEAIISVKGKIFRISIPYSHRCEDEIASASGFTYANPNITDENFSTDEEKAQGTVETDAISVPFSELRESEKVTSMTSEEVIAALDKKGLRPGTPKELVALHKTGDDQRALQDELPLVALGGKVWRGSDGYRHVAYLDRDGSRRRLGLYWFALAWHSHFRFLAFRK